MAYDLTVTKIVNVYHTRTSRWQMPQPTYRRNNGLIYLTDGSITYHFDHGDETAVPGSLLIFPQGLRYCGDKQTDYQAYYVIDFETLSPDALASLSLPLIMPGGAWAQRAFAECEATWRTGTLHTQLRCKEHLYALLAGLMDSRSDGQKRSDDLEEMLRYIHRHYMEPDFGVDSLSRKFHLSASQLRRIFARVLQVSPLQYVLNLRIELAQNLLRHEGVSVHETAMHCGFASDAYFSRLFKDRTGMSPSAFRGKPPL